MKISNETYYVIRYPDGTYVVRNDQKAHFLGNARFFASKASTIGIRNLMYPTCEILKIHFEAESLDAAEEA